MELSALQTAERLGVSRRYIIQLIGEGVFPGARRAWPGSKGPWLIPVREVEKYEKQKAGKG